MLTAKLKNIEAMQVLIRLSVIIVSIGRLVATVQQDFPSEVDFTCGFSTDSRQRTSEI